jgi:hypothetical protein
MTPIQKTLYDKLQNFSVDKSYIDFSFDKRLARENAWSLAYSRRVIAEYKKFLLLASTAGHPCTPSDQVDMAWHLHLTYTKSYWNDLCVNVLPAPLHHNPTEGGAAEGQKFEDWYARTRQSYREIFGYEPPADIWPPAQERFGKAPHFKRIDVSDYWLISKKQVQQQSTWISVAAVLLLVVTACSSSADNDLFMPLAITVAVVSSIYFVLKNTLLSSKNAANTIKSQSSERTQKLANRNSSEDIATSTHLSAATHTSKSPHHEHEDTDNDSSDNADTSSDSDSTSSDSGGDSGCGSSGCGGGCGGD